MPPSNLLLASKIVVTEEAPSIRNIPGVPTSIMCFAGVTERGPMRTPVFTTSWDEWVETFGGYLANSDLPLAVRGAFINGATAVWTSRIQHYTDLTDSGTGAGARGSLTILDRGGAASEAELVSATGPFALKPSQQLDLNIDGSGTDSLTFTAAGASVTAGGAGPYALANNDTLVFQTKLPGDTSLQQERTITFNDSSPLIAAIGAATAQELANFINADPESVGIRAEVDTGALKITTDFRGSGASLVVSATSTSIAGGKLNITAGTTSGTGNVADIDAVTAAEIAALLTALPLSAGTATAASDQVTVTSDATGASASVVVENTTTALGIFTGALPITENGSAAGTSNTMTVEGKDPGTYIESYSVVISAATSGDADRFNFTVYKGASLQESWANLSMDDTDARYFEDFLDDNSSLIRVTDLASAAVSPNNLPALGTYSSWAGANDGLTGLVDADYVGDSAGQTGLYAFDVVDNMSLLAVPGRATSAVHNAMIAYCETHRAGTCFAVLDPPTGLDEQGIKTYVGTTAAIKGLSEFAAIYWPNVKILNPSTAVFGSAPQLTVPPSGHILGVYARTDASTPGGVYVPPAGVENGLLFEVLGFETDDVLDERKRDVVYPERINPLTVIDDSPRHIDGTRTLKGDGNFPTVAERRGVIFIEQSLKAGLLFAKHRNNDRRLRMEVKRSIQAFLLRQYANGAFRGNTPAESFTVDVSDALNTIERIFNGELHARIGLATQKPADFIVLTFTQDTRELDQRLATQLGS